MKKNYRGIKNNQTAVEMFFLLIGITSPFLFTSIRMISIFNFVIIFSILFNNIRIRKKILLLHAFIAGFLFVIIPEGIIDYQIIEYDKNGHLALTYIIICFYLVLFAYYIYPLKKKRNKNLKGKIVYKENIGVIIVFIVLISLYVYTRFPMAIAVFFFGRNYYYNEFANSSPTLHALNTGISLGLPTIIAYYYKFILKSKNIIFPLTLSSPIFITLFMFGARFPVLFAFGGFITTYFLGYRFTHKKIAQIIFTILVLFIATKVMYISRIHGLKSFTMEKLIFDTKYSHEDIYTQIASLGSKEGVVKSTASMISYFESNNLLYGKSLAYLFVFWIPRSIWPEKPYSLGVWLVRSYDYNVPRNHSVSYGFSGDFYADFGILGGLFFSLILGVLLKFYDREVQLVIKNKQFNFVLGVLSYSYVFFFVRSPLTSTMMFISIVFIYLVIKKILVNYTTRKTIN